MVLTAFDFETKDIQFEASPLPTFDERWVNDPTRITWELIFGDAYRNGVRAEAILFTYAFESTEGVCSGCIDVAEGAGANAVKEFVLSDGSLYVGANIAFDVGILSNIVPSAPRLIGGRCIDVLVHVRFAMFAHALSQYLNGYRNSVEAWLSDPSTSFILAGANLKGLVGANLGVQMKKWIDVKDDEEALRQYAIEDAKRTLQLFQHLHRQGEVVVTRRGGDETYPIFIRCESGASSVDALMNQIDWDGYYARYPLLRDIPADRLLLYFGYACRQYFAALSNREPHTLPQRTAPPRRECSIPRRVSVIGLGVDKNAIEHGKGENGR